MMGGASGVSTSSGDSDEQGDKIEEFASHIVSSREQQSMSDDTVAGTTAVSSSSGDDEADNLADTGSSDISKLMTSRNFAAVPGNSWPSTLGRLHIPSAKERENAHVAEQWHETNSNQLPLASEDEDPSGPSLRDSERDS